MKTRSEFMSTFLNNLDDRLSDQGLNGAKLAKLQGMSRMHLHRHLRRYFNMSAREIILQRRLSEARKLLSDNTLSISEIAVKVGFKDSAYFSRKFRQSFGAAPSKFRTLEEE